MDDESESDLKPSCSHSNVNVVETDDEDQYPSSKDSDTDPDFKVPKRVSSNNWQMRIQLKSTALLSDRFGVSDRATAAIASSALHDVGLITDSDVSHVIDKNKMLGLNCVVNLTNFHYKVSIWMGGKTTR